MVPFEEDDKFRAFYRITFDDEAEKRKFVNRLQNQPASWDKQLAWVIDPKNNSAEAYIEILRTDKDQILRELLDFVVDELPVSLHSRIWSWITKPYWWWKTRKLKSTTPT